MWPILREGRRRRVRQSQPRAERPRRPRLLLCFECGSHLHTGILEKEETLRAGGRAGGRRAAGGAGGEPALGSGPGGPGPRLRTPPTVAQALSAACRCPRGRRGRRRARRCGARAAAARAGRAARPRRAWLPAAARLWGHTHASCALARASRIASKIAGVRPRR